MVQAAQVARGRVLARVPIYWSSLVFPAVLAGGAIRAIMLDQEPRDIDVFIHNSDFEAFQWCAANAGLQLHFDHKAVCNVVGTGVQIIAEYATRDTIDGFITDFDFRCSAVGIELWSGEMSWVEGAAEDIEARQLYPMHKQKEETWGTRIARYCGYGFHLVENFWELEKAAPPKHRLSRGWLWRWDNDKERMMAYVTTKEVLKERGLCEHATYAE